MTIKCEVEADNLFVYRISGKLGKAEYQAAQGQIEGVIKTHGKVRILVILQGFAGWERAPGWEDLSFPQRNDPYLEKMAIVGDPQWQDLVYAFTLKGLRRVPIEYFATAEESRARAWLDAGP